MGFQFVFIGLRVGVLNPFLVRGVGNLPIKKVPGGFARGDGQAWN